MITYQQETVETVERDIVPLMQDHDKCLVNDIMQEYPLDVNLGLYKKLFDLGVLKIFTARDGEVLAGYLTIIIHPSLHRQSLVGAHEDAFYIRPEYRRGRNAMRLMAFAEAELVKTCKIIVYHSPESNPHFGHLLTKLGVYEKHATYFIRRL